jgi:predicted TPR repeat methyltransferase
MAQNKDECAAAEVAVIYDDFAEEFDRDRCKNLMEAPYLRDVLARLDCSKRILDLGCGSGEPIARFFIEAGCFVTGVDVAEAMLKMCRTRFPQACWIQYDMRSLNLRDRFDVLIAWDSFFHLTQDDQRLMFPIFQQHTSPNGFLMFTSGAKAGISLGRMYGRDLFHASLDTEEYDFLLVKHGFDVLLHRVEDPECGDHTVWIAQRAAD